MAGHNDCFGRSKLALDPFTYTYICTHATIKEPWGAIKLLYDFAIIYISRLDVLPIV